MTELQLYKLLVDNGVDAAKSAAASGIVFQKVADGSINPANLAAILQFILEILPLILPLFAG